MNLNNFTLKSQEAIQQAQQIATTDGHQAVETGHILKGILAVDENVTPFLLKKLHLNNALFSEVVDRIVQSYPKVDGGGQYLSNNANKALLKAVNSLKEFNDEFVSIEHLLLGILESGDQVAQMMKDQGINAKDLKAAIKDIEYRIQDPRHRL